MKTTLKTYSHLATDKRIPGDYEVATSKLHYYVERGFEVRTPIASWYARYQRGSRLVCPDWDLFVDPQRTTYSTYATLRARREAFVDELFEAIDVTDSDARLHPDWVSTLQSIVPPLRYPVHALQMTAAYVGSMAPSGRLTVAAMFQAADELRRVERIAYRMAQLRTHCPGFGTDARARWEKDQAWQPLRKLIERLLVTYDWGEAFVVLDLLLKPAFDALFTSSLADVAERHDDWRFASILRSLGADCAWHAEWSSAAAKMAIDARPENREVIRSFYDVWTPGIERAISSLSTLLGAEGEHAGRTACSAPREQLAALGVVPCSP